MKKLLLSALLSLLCFFSTKSIAGFAGTITDTSIKRTHVIDGNISEWKLDKFETDKETNIQYTVDHDANNLYAALKISDQRLQMKLMTQGMSFYIDKKGKKKEGTGIDFPVKKEGFGGYGGGGKGRSDENGNTQKPDPKEMRERLASTMIFLKTFGFDGQEDKTQLIVMENGIHVAFDWDEANIMYIEYQVPITFFGNQASLNGKPLGIGWKINGASMPDANAGGNSNTFGRPSVPGGGGRGGGGGGSRGGGAGIASVDFGPSSDSRFKEQSIWTKYLINF